MRLINDVMFSYKNEKLKIFIFKHIIELRKDMNVLRMYNILLYYDNLIFFINILLK